MEKTFETAVVSLIEKATTGIDKATDFLSAELPDVIVQLMHWHTISSAIWFSVGVFFFLVASLIVGFLVRKGVKESDDDYYLGGFISATLYLIPVTIMGCNMDWFQIWIAPKVWLIEYAASLAKSCGG